MSDRNESRFQYKLNVPADLKVVLEEQAKRSGRSLSSEIIARLQASITGTTSDPDPGSGMTVMPIGALEKLLARLEASVEGSHQLFLEVREDARRLGGGISQVENYRLEPALHRFMAENKLERGEAVRLILGEWLAKHGYIGNGAPESQAAYLDHPT
ncbi:Arc family DNA-binding protein [Agrobacterium rubi]|nr:Arc family DNA-binding protein [Agrobacterium rubi]NTF23844.1 Arc family DNA-binding protein [Agrobacterium rubi]